MGKLITFWSPCPGRAGVTSVLCAVAAALALEYPKLEIAISHTSDFMELEERLEGGLGRARKKEWMEQTGISALKLHYRQAVLTSEKIRNCAIPLRIKSLLLFSGGRQENNEELWFQIMTKKLPEEFSMTLLDLENGWSDTSLSLMQKADVAVVVLPPEVIRWKRFLKQELEKLSNSRIYLILGGYLEHSRYSFTYFSKAFAGGNRILGAIPRNAAYFDAMVEGRTLDFFLRNQMVEKKEENYEFIMQTKKSAKRLKEIVEGRT